MGEVELDDAEKFENFLKTADWEVKPFRQHNLIMFDSPGGSLSGGIKLGKKIRELGFAVGIGKTVPYPDSALHELEDGTCISACAYAFLGGKYRYLDNRPGFDDGQSKTCLGFHQFFDKSAIARNDVLSTQQTTQIISGIVVEYLNEIGAPLDIYTFASKFTEQEYGCINKDEELNKLIDNANFEYSEVKLLPFGKGLVAEIKSHNDGHSMRLYCSGNQSLVAFFLPGNKADAYKSGLVNDDMKSTKLKFNAKNVVTSARIILIKTINEGQKTALVFAVENSFIQSAFEFGELQMFQEDSDRASDSWMSTLGAIVKGNSKIPKLLKNNCIS